MTIAFCSHCGKQRDIDDFICVFQRPYPKAAPRQTFYCQDSDCYSISSNKKRSLKQIQRAINNRRNYPSTRNK
jgi:hypothetical protein